MSAKRKDRPLPKAKSMSRQQLVEAILRMKCDFPLDFTAKYLSGLPMEKLRHLYLALRPLTNQQQGPPAGA